MSSPMLCVGLARRRYLINDLLHGATGGLLSDASQVVNRNTCLTVTHLSVYLEHLL